MVTDPVDLTLAIANETPRYVFFPHWSHIVPEEIVSEVECVCFHMTDVPYGKGGSPLQNLISRGHRETQLTALRMVEAVDAGPVYLKRPLSLHGSAEEIFTRAMHLSVEMMRAIIAEEPHPKEQSKLSSVHFQRRQPAQSALPSMGTLGSLRDHIRMLDAKGYPPAFIDHGAFRFHLGSVEVCDDGSLNLRARIKERPIPDDYRICLREAVMEDCRAVYDWRYASDLVQFYKSGEVPTYQAHASWFEARLAAEETMLLMGNIEGLSVSHIRLDRHPEGYEVSICSDPTRRGQGIGKKTLKAAIDFVGTGQLIAEVDERNDISLGLFRSCGFTETGRKGRFLIFKFARDDRS